jgi:hypothetical protein
LRASAGDAGDFARRIARPAGEAAGHIIQHEHGMNGFGEDFEEVAFFGSFLEQFLGGLLAGEENQAASGMRIANDHGEVDAIHLRQQDIDDREVGGPRGDGFNRLFSGFGDPHFVAVLRKDCSQGLHYFGFVIDNQDSTMSIYTCTCHSRLLGKNAKAKVAILREYIVDSVLVMDHGTGLG